MKKIIRGFMAGVFLGICNEILGGSWLGLALFLAASKKAPL